MSFLFIKRTQRDGVRNLLPIMLKVQDFLSKMRSKEWVLFTRANTGFQQWGLKSPKKNPPPQGPPYSPLNFFRGRGGLEKYLVYKNELGGLSNKILYLNTNQKYCLYQTKMRINNK